MSQPHHQCQQCKELRPDSKLNRTRVFYECKDKKGCRKRAENLSKVRAREIAYYRDSDLRSLDRARRALRD